MFPGYDLHETKWLHIEIGWVVEGVNLEFVQVPNAVIKKLKSLYVANFLKGAHHCQSDLVPVAGFLCSLQCHLASCGITTNSASCSTYVPCAVVSLYYCSVLPAPEIAFLCTILVLPNLG